MANSRTSLPTDTSEQCSDLILHPFACVGRGACDEDELGPAMASEDSTVKVIRVRVM